MIPPILIHIGLDMYVTSGWKAFQQMIQENMILKTDKVFLTMKKKDKKQWCKVGVTAHCGGRW